MGNYIPPEVLNEFLKSPAQRKQAEQAKAEVNKIEESNKGYELLMKMGWDQKKGLGSKGQGRTAPIEVKPKEDKNAGLGVDADPTYAVKEGDDIYEQYKKRMMLGYRFRPNPLNNPRKQYY